LLLVVLFLLLVVVWVICNLIFDKK
jgi:hypothetical protein